MKTEFLLASIRHLHWAAILSLLCVSPFFGCTGGRPSEESVKKMIREWLEPSILLARNWGVLVFEHRAAFIEAYHEYHNR